MWTTKAGPPKDQSPKHVQQVTKKRATDPAASSVLRLERGYRARLYEGNRSSKDAGKHSMACRCVAVVVWGRRACTPNIVQMKPWCERQELGQVVNVLARLACSMISPKKRPRKNVHKNSVFTSIAPGRHEPRFTLQSVRRAQNMFT